MVRKDASRFVIVLGVAAVAASSGACGHQNNPIAPTSSSMPALLPAPAAATGATISGTVVGVSSSSLIKTQRVSITVSANSSSSATVDDTGHFTLRNVPAGHVDLHFVSTGVDAHLALENIAEHATVVITVRLTDHFSQ